MTVAEAVVAKLQTWATAQPFLVSVYFVQVPGIPPVDPVSKAGRYLVVFPIADLWSAEGINAVSSDVAVTVQVTSVAWLTADLASPADEVQFLQNQVKLQVADWTPSVSGLVISPFRHVRAGNLRTDEVITDRQVVYAVDQFSLTAVRTS